MARRSVNAVVSVAALAALAASVAGVAAADGYWLGDSAGDDVNVEAVPAISAGIVSDEPAVELAPGGAVLSPLAPMQLSPLEGPDLPPIQIAAPAGMVRAPASASAPPQPARRTKAS
ncbi:MAG: hypothetical protein HOH95_03020 [Dehalococcoidia bacterium]|nr:hypothetical protein [Dehalococcoidia bacterium]